MEYNIFQNDFYESRPGLPWAYRLTALYGPLADETAVITKAIKEAHLPDHELKAIQVFFGGADKYVPTRYQNYGTFSLTFNEDCNLSAYKTLLRLFRRSLDNREDTEDRHYKYSNLQWELKLVLEILDPKNINLQDTKVKTKKDSDGDDVIAGREHNDMRVVAKYEFGNCFIDKIDDIDLDYSSEEIIEWTVTVGYNSIAITYPGKKKLTLGAEDTFTETEFEAYDSYDRYHKTDDLDRAAKNAVKSMQESEKKREDNFNAAEAYRKAQEELQKIKDNSKKEREGAMGKGDEDSNDEGYTSTGDFVTEAQKEAVIQKEIENVHNEQIEGYKIEHKFDEWTQLGVNLETMSESEIQDQLRSAYKDIVNDPESTGYGLDSWDNEAKLVQAGLEAKRSWEGGKKELEQDMLKAEDEVRFAFRESGTIETNLTESTNQYYDGKRSTQEGKTELFNDRGAKIRELQNVIHTYEDEYEKMKEKEVEWHKATMAETDPRRKKEKYNYMVDFQRRRKEAEAKMKEAQDAYNKLQAENKSY